MKIIKITLLVIGALMLLGFLLPQLAHPSCLMGGGHWRVLRMFNNGCQDFCGEHRVCTQVMTYGCDCGPEQCWNGNQCVPNPTSPKDERHELSSAFEGWFATQTHPYDFEHPYITCILNHSCNGTFVLSVRTSEEQIPVVEAMLKEYGGVKRSYCINEQKCDLRLETGNIYNVNNFISNPFIKSVYLVTIKSDYRFPISEKELHFCENDDECVRITPDCCGCGSGGVASTINKKYLNEWSSYHTQSCGSVSCPAIMSLDVSCFSEPKCVSNTCTLVHTKEGICSSFLLESCEGALAYNQEYPNDETNLSDNSSMGISCNEVLTLCQRALTKIS